MTSIAYLGPRGTFTEEALMSMPVSEGAELRALVAQLFATKTPLTNPFGRPTYIELNHGELARRFSR